MTLTCRSVTPLPRAVALHQQAPRPLVYAHRDAFELRVIECVDEQGAPVYVIRKESRRGN